MNNYPLGDFLIRIKNGGAVDKKTVVVPWSKKLEEIAKILVDSSLLKRFDVSKEKAAKKEIIAELAYHGAGKPLFKEIKFFSKPGRRYYVGYKDLPYTGRSNAIVIVSTSQGLMTARKARKKNLGGEVIAEIY